MRTKLILFLPLLAVLAVSSGCVASRTPVGDKVAALEPKIWNGKWRDGDGGVVTTKIKDARVGIVRMTNKAAWLKRGETHEILVRMLGPLTIANEEMGGGYGFGRVVNDGTHLVVFGADRSVFERLIKRHEIAGEIERDKQRKPTGACSIEGLSRKDYQRLKNEGFDVRSLFEEDPSTVLVRDKWMPIW